MRLKDVLKKLHSTDTFHKKGDYCQYYDLKQGCQLSCNDIETYLDGVLWRVVRLFRSLLYFAHSFPRFLSSSFCYHTLAHIAGLPSFTKGLERDFGGRGLQSLMKKMWTFEASLNFSFEIKTVGLDCCDVVVMVYLFLTINICVDGLLASTCSLPLCLPSA